MKGHTHTHVTETLWDRVVKWCRPWACGYLALRRPYGMSNGVPGAVSLFLTEGHVPQNPLRKRAGERRSSFKTPQRTLSRLGYRTYVRICLRSRGR